MKIGIAGNEIDYYVTEGKVYHNKFFVKIIIQSLDFDEMEMNYRNGKTNIETQIIPSSSSFWVEVTEKNFSDAYLNMGKRE